MKKTLRLFFAAALAMVGFNAMAQEVTLDFTSAENPWSLPTDYDKTEKSYTNGGVTITINAANGHKVNTKDGYLIFGKQDATLSFSAFSFDVEMIKVTGRAGASGKVTQNIFVGETAVSTETTGATGTYNYKIAEANQAAGTIYVLKVTNANNTQITKIEIYKKGSGAKEGAGLSWGTGSRSVTIGAEDNLFPELANPNNLPVTYSSSKEEVATIAANGAITLVAAGSTVISAKFAGDDKYEAQEVTYTLTVKAAGGDTPEPQPTDIETITVAKALEIGASLEGGKTSEKEYIVNGFVVAEPTWTPYKDKTTNEIKNYNLQFQMNDTKGATEGALLVYNAWNLENTYFPTIDENLKVDVEVSLQGKIQNYVKNEVSTIELVRGHFLKIGNNVSSISTVKAEQLQGKMFNLQGQRVARGYKGIMIQNGKKVLVK